MKIQERILIFSTIIILSVMMFMQLTEYNVRQDELNNCITTAMSSTQVVMSEQIEDEVYGTHNRRKTIASNAEYVEEFANNFYKLITSNTSYQIEVYAVDYEKGLLSIGVTGKFKMYNGEIKTITSRKTSIVEVIK